MYDIDKFTEQAFIQDIEPQDRPVKEKKPDALKSIQMIKLGDVVKFGDPVIYEGPVTSKRGLYLTMNAGERGDKIFHVNDVYNDDILTSRLWNQMAMESRYAFLRKNNIPSGRFVERNYYDLPKVIQEKVKEGFAGREPGITRESESQSYRDAINPPHVAKPVKDEKEPELINKPIRGHNWEYWQNHLARRGYDRETAASIIGNWEKKERQKSDVEHGWYGGIATDTEPLDATEDYEEDRREGDRKQLRHEHQRDASDKRTGITLRKGGDGKSKEKPVNKNPLAAIAGPAIAGAARAAAPAISGAARQIGPAISGAARQIGPAVSGAARAIGGLGGSGGLGSMGSQAAGQAAGSAIGGAMSGSSSSDDDDDDNAYKSEQKSESPFNSKLGKGALGSTLGRVGSQAAGQAAGSAIGGAMSGGGSSDDSKSEEKSQSPFNSKLGKGALGPMLSRAARQAANSAEKKAKPINKPGPLAALAGPAVAGAIGGAMSGGGSDKSEEKGEGGGDSGTATTSTEGMNNPVHSEKPDDSKRKKKFYNSRYGIRYGVTSIEESNNYIRKA